MTATATKKRPAAQTEAKSVNDLILEALGQNEEYKAACDKQRALQRQLTQAQAEFDQLNAAAETDVAELADRILAGDELSEREQVFAKRQALAQRIEAYKAAMGKQALIIAELRNQASQAVEDALRPNHSSAYARLMAAIAEVESAKNELFELQTQLNFVHRIKHRLHFVGLQQLVATVNQLNAVRDGVAAYERG